MTPLEKFKELVETSGAISVDRGPYLSSWVLAKNPEDYDADDTVFETSWTDGDCLYESAVTREDVENGMFTEDAFVCVDSNGDTTRFEFYAVTNLLSGKRVGQ